MRGPQDSGSASHGRIEVAPGTIRRIIRRTRSERVVNPGSIDPDTATRARAEINATIPVFDSDAGRAELAGYHARARFGSGR